MRHRASRSGRGLPQAAGAMRQLPGLRLTAVHPGVTVDQVRAATGWDLEVGEDLTVVEPPTDAELRLLRHTVDPDRIYLR